MTTLKANILIVDDQKNIRKTMIQSLAMEGYACFEAENQSACMAALKKTNMDLVFLDIRLGPEHGLDVYKNIKKLDSDMPVVFISGHADLSEVAECIQMGGFDFLEKPFSNEKLKVTALRAIEYCRSQKKLDQYALASPGHDLIARSLPMQKLIEDLNKVSSTHAGVFISGESGTGKERIASAIHHRSGRASFPLVKVNCSAIPDHLIESELFGYVKGAFTGAHQNKKGYFEQAHRGTLFLDEVADLSLAAQAKLLRALQEKEFQKVGSEHSTSVDVRVVAASHKNFEAEMAAGRFRQDLYFRLNVLPLHLPPLRERLEDFDALLEQLLLALAHEHHLPLPDMSSEDRDRLKAHAWPGNIRELKNVLERFLILGPEALHGLVLDPSGSKPAMQAAAVHRDKAGMSEHVEMLGDQKSEQNEPQAMSGSFSPPEDVVALKQYRQALERHYILWVLRQCLGNVSQAADRLKIARSHLHKKMTDYGIEKSDLMTPPA